MAQFLFTPLYRLNLKSPFVYQKECKVMVNDLLSYKKNNDQIPKRGGKLWTGKKE